ncbi:O-antigen ligase family protein [Aequorivita antarctica]|uniref:O-antigen ligase family protein n=1 Tax=Aequorivita antarctica TaxID=153266 RepID=A0A5C6Z5U4_9FLAO|nr:O-antigen ligase family protein [Aequorivita antarctica]TXD74774.1 O-antigen ligase family protein [Aequorivita antarctica]
MVSSLFWISLIGLLYSENMVDGLKNFQKQLPFLVFPLIFFTVEISRKTKLILLKYFSYGVIVSASFALLKAIYFKWNNFGDYFYYDKLGQLLDIHTTYFAMYVLIALLYFTSFISRKPFKKRLIYGLCIVFLLWFLYLLSVRVSIMALIVSGLILIYGNRKSITPKTIFLLIGGVLLIVLFYFTPNFQKRFNAKTPEGIAISDVDTRTVHWQSALEVIGKNNLFFGAGTGDGHEILYDQYLENGFETGYIYQYNAHNQFLETALYYGLFGLVFLITIIFIVIKKCYLCQNYLGAAIIITQIVFMITESTLESQSGIVLFAYFTAMMASRSFSDKIRIN